MSTYQDKVNKELIIDILKLIQLPIGLQDNQYPSSQ